MDKRAAGQYLDTLFGDRAGHVAVAYKDKGQSWQECQFEWPKERSKLIGWADVHHDANIFVCPALRKDAHTRKKGDMQPTRWLWADVDWQAVPGDKREDVKARIADIGTYVVSSGSGDNVHVYVELSQPVEHVDFIKLNTGLRDYLYADNKQADNSLLRLPGTTNWKTEQGSPVAARGGNGRKASKAALLKRRAFRDAKVIADAEATEWSFIEVEGLSRRVRSWVTMPVDEAVARYGTRHEAVWAITGDLIKRGLGPDEVHSLMDKFPAALSKAADENGYDVHRDVDKRFAYARATAALTEEEVEHIEEEAFELATEADDAEEYAARVQRLAAAELERSEARKLARTMEAERAWSAPPADVSWSLHDVLSDPPQPAQYLIGIPPGAKRGLCGVKHNVVITAQYKTGKTKFVIATIAKALADGEDFMGCVPVHTPVGGVVVGHWNCEMDAAEMASDYVIPADIHNVKNLRGANLRGYRVNLLTPQGKRWAVQWLRGEIANPDGSYPPPVKVWTIDSLARLARMAGVSEKDNDEMFDLLMALDEVKVEAEVDVLFLITHTGRTPQEEGKERARGATAIDDWCDARWIMTNESGVRFLAVDGRGVGMDASPLVYDEATGHSDKGFGGREEVKADGAIETIVRLVKDSPGITQKALQDALRGKMSARTVLNSIEDAIDANKVEIREDASGRGKPAKRHYLTSDSKPEGDRRMNATPQNVDLRGVRGSRSRRKSSV